VKNFQETPLRDAAHNGHFSLTAKSLRYLQMLIAVITCDSMSATRIHRYIIKEISTPAVLSLLIFTFLLLMGKIPGLTELVINKGVPASEILQLFSYLLPSFLRITLPLAFLLGILLAFSRLSADSEFIAIKASGISLYTMLKPVLMMAFVCCLFTAALTLSLEPAGKTAFRSKLFQIVSSRASVGIRPGIFNDDFAGLVLYARSMDERHGIMQGVFISDERLSETPATIFAQQGRFISDPSSYRLTLRLNQGSIHRHPARGQNTTYQTIGFDVYDINLNVGQQLAKGEERRRSRGELSWREIEQAYAASKDKNTRFNLQVEKHMRITLAFSPLFFALVGVPLGLQSNRSGKGAGFSLALGISLIYFLLFSAASAIAKEFEIPVPIALWLPSLCFLLGGSYFIHRTAIEHPIRFSSRLPRLLSRIFDRRKGREQA